MLPPFPFASVILWWQTHGRHDLPWRQVWDMSDTDRLYRVWLAEILLQQTQAERVIPFYIRILDRYPTLDNLARETFEGFFPYYQGLGYYHRAHNILATARIVVDEYDGIFPRESSLLRTLPWVGTYTTEAIRAFGWDLPTLAMDTNLNKIFARYYLGSRIQKLPTDLVQWLVKDIAKSEISGRTVNMALMDFARLVSHNTIGNIDFEHYPLMGCRFGETRGTLETVIMKKSTPFPTRDARIAVRLHTGHTAYYSSDADTYTPFFLPPTNDDVRRTVQAYFRENHDTEVSVRPIRRRGYHHDSPYILVNAQIQTGVHTFFVFSRKMAYGWEETFFDG